jgi:hypothetical protein
MTDHRPPADEGAGYAPPAASGAGSSSAGGASGKGALPAGKVGEEPGAAGRKAWREAISANNAAKARGRKWAKSQRPKPGMLRKPPPGEGT